MTTATTPGSRSLVAVPDNSSSTSLDIKRCSYTLTAHTRWRGKLRTSKLDFTALALLDGGSMLTLVGGGNDEQARALKAMLFRVTVDDDGVCRDVEPRLVRDDQVSYAWLDGDTDDPDDEDDAGPEDDGPTPIPGDAALGKLRKSALVALAEEYGLDPDGVNTDVAARLAEHRDTLADDGPGSELAVPDVDGVVDGVIDSEPAVWRLVWPRDEGASENEPWELADEQEFSRRDLAVRYAAENGSSLRRLTIGLSDPDMILTSESLNDAVGTVAEAATDRPTGPSGASRRSPRNRGRRAPTSGGG